MAVNKKNIMTRYFFVVLVMGLIGVAIIVKGTVIMFACLLYTSPSPRDS